MDILNAGDIHFLLSLGVITAIFLVFYYTAGKRQNRVLTQVDNGLKRQAEANQQLNLIINELRRANRLLAEIAGMEYVEEPAVEVGSNLPLSQSSGGTSESDNQHKLYVGNIDYLATESELASYFSPYGQVEFVNIPVNRYTGKARGFGFVTFVSREDAERAMALHGTEFKGRQIQVNFAKERDPA